MLKPALSLRVQKKCLHINICNTETTGQIPTVDQDHEISLKAPEQPLSGPCSGTLSIGPNFNLYIGASFAPHFQFNTVNQKNPI